MREVVITLLSPDNQPCLYLIWAKGKTQVNSQQKADHVTGSLHFRGISGLWMRAGYDGSELLKWMDDEVSLHPRSLLTSPSDLLITRSICDRAASSKRNLQSGRGGVMRSLRWGEYFFLFFFLMASSGLSRRCFVSHRDQMHVALSNIYM